MIKIVHLSDLHFRLNFEEDQELVLRSFFKDLEKQILSFNKNDIYVAFSGDVVFSGNNQELYEAFFKQFDEELNRLGIPSSQRICVPGNHDVSQDYIASKFTDHESVINYIKTEKEFNDYIIKPDNVFLGKFSIYRNFESKFSKYGIDGDMVTGKGFDLREDISIYCLNSAICSSGGYKESSDKHKLSIDTRNLQKWILACKSKTKILLMHHSLDWLTEWARSELKTILRNNFSLYLSGHVHDQEMYHSINNNGSDLIECTAPPLLTNKKDLLGYSIITVSDHGVLEIQYRQWIKKQNFVTGVNFSNTDDGKVIINKSEVEKALGFKEEMSNILTQNLNEALESYSTQPIVWVEPLISDTTQIGRRGDEDEHEIKHKIEVQEILSNTESYIIKAPPQFGLTCLAHYLIKKAWDMDSSVWIYLDAKINRTSNLDNNLKKEIEKRKTKIKDVKCVVLDSWTNIEKDSFKVIEKLCDISPDLKIVVMHTIDDVNFMTEPSSETIKRDFKVGHLLAMSRNKIRKVVSEVNSKKHFGEDDAVISKVVSDLDVLNIHRTPLNCLTILKVSEKYYDESPVNRTKMLERVLNLLFDTDEIPTYKSKPDVTDCAFVLGYFCENMIRTERYSFSRDEFLLSIRKFCTDNFLSLEVEVVFDVLYKNHIIIRRIDQYVFRAVYWVYYFAAQRMHHSPDFAKHMFENKKYLAFPEIIEFYTGIDRRREDALTLLLNDLREICDIVFTKVGMPDGMDPYKFIKWEPTKESLEKMNNLIGENVRNSGLPDAVKDKYADVSYNPVKPYNQSVHKIFHEYSVHVLMQSIRSTSRALRNSDFVNPKIKRELLSELTRGWEQISKVLFALTPMLASEGEAAFEGQNFYLNGDFGTTLEERANLIIDVIPNNVVRFFKDDIFSNKIGPLIFDQFSNESCELKKLELVLLLIYERPISWRATVHKYVVSISKNSFYLAKVLTALNNEYQYSFASPIEVKEIGLLIKLCIAKHEFGDPNPTANKINMISNINLPKRLIEFDDPG